MEKHCCEKHPSPIVKHASIIEDIDIPAKLNNCCCGDSCDICGGGKCLVCGHPPEPIF